MRDWVGVLFVWWVRSVSQANSWFIMRTRIACRFCSVWRWLKGRAEPLWQLGTTTLGIRLTPIPPAYLYCLFVQHSQALCLLIEKEFSVVLEYDCGVVWSCFAAPSLKSYSLLIGHLKQAWCPASGIGSQRQAVHTFLHTFCRDSVLIRNASGSYSQWLPGTGQADKRLGKLIFFK